MAAWSPPGFVTTDDIKIGGGESRNRSDGRENGESCDIREESYIQEEESEESCDIQRVQDDGS